MAAVAVPSSSKLSVSFANPFHMATGKHGGASDPPAPSSSKLAAPQDATAPQPKTFRRLRSSLEQSIRTATKSRGKSHLVADDFGEVVQVGKGKERASEEAVPQEEKKGRSRMLSRVSFRRPAGKEAASPQGYLHAGQAREADRPDKDRDKRMGSLRQGSMSSPDLHLSEHPYAPFAMPAASSSNVAALVSPPRERSRKPEVQSAVSSKIISGPIPLAPRRDIRSNGGPATPTSNGKAKPPPLDLSSPGFPRRSREATRSPEPASPSPRRIPSSRDTASTGHLPLGSPPGSPTTPRATSPLHARSPSRTPAPRAGTSSSAVHLPLSSSGSPRRPSFDHGRSSLEQKRPSFDQRRPSMDQQRPSVELRRPSAEMRRPSVEQRRSSVDQQRGTASGTPPPPSRAASPTTPVRPYAASPTPRNYSPSYYQNRFYNISSGSLALSANPEHREVIRSASSVLCKEMLKRPSQLDKSSLSAREWEEVEVRMRALARLERVWGKSGVGSATQLSSGLNASGVSSSGEERERRLFGEALKDGFVLCHFLNKLFPFTISRIDHKEDGRIRTSNVTRFLASCSSVGLRSEELFERDDLLGPSPGAEALARVAKTILALQKATESPDDSKVLHGRKGDSSSSPQGPYGTVSRAAASTPNLPSLQRSVSPTSSPVVRKRWSPSQPLPTLRSDSPDEEGSRGSSEGRTVNGSGVLAGWETPGTSDLDDVPPIISPPPRSPLRPRPSIASSVDSTRASLGESMHSSLADSYAPSVMRQSLASTATTDSAAFSSLLDVRRNSNTGNKFGTIRTMTTEATSVEPGDPFGFREDDEEPAAVSSPPEMEQPRKPARPPRERRPSETAVIDLSRVVEETEESSTSAKAGRSGREHEQPRKVSAIKLGKGKWPDDFLGAFQAPPSNGTALLDEEELPQTPTSPASGSPRKRAIVGGGNPRPESVVDTLPQFPRRPTHRSRHSVDTPGLLPKDQALRRDSSPDLISPSSPRVMLRRSSTKTGARNGMLVPRSTSGSRDSETRVPFPRTVSAEYTAFPVQDSPTDTPPSESSSGNRTPESVLHQDKPRQPRGRFQSEVDGASSRRKPRPTSYDELGAVPRRSRFESMVNLGATSNASASDLLTRDSMDGSAVRHTLIVREEGKPATQFQLGNCIGRGQFGAVYRALNLNTGQMVAVKRIQLEGLKEDEISQLMREVDLVKSLSHPSIVKYEGMARDNNVLSIVLELAENGSLGQTLKAFGKLNERLVASYVVKILEGLDYLHRSDVVHCDLKAANILTTKNGNVKLSDFGVSLNLRAMEREMKDVAGTPNWMAPEVIELKGASTKSDIWSLGCTVIELLTGRPPYAEIGNGMSVMFRIVEDDMPPLPEGASESLRDFLTLCFQKDPANRPSAETLCEHEWLSQFSLLLNDLRPQDSIPFLRRVSTDLQKSDALRYLANMDTPDSDKRSMGSDKVARMDHRLSRSPTRRRMSNDPEPISPREHSFVPTQFGKPVICRVCLESVKKSAVLCEQCSLIAHVKCAPNAPPTCDLRSQLLLYAHLAESGSPTSPMDILEAIQTGSPTADSMGTPRTSMDSSQLSSSPPQGAGVHPPSAFKVLSAFKRSRSALTVEQAKATPPPVPVPGPSSPPTRTVTHKRSVLKKGKETRERRVSIASASTSPNSSSVRSTVTAADTQNSRRSRVSVVEPERPDKTDSRLSRMTSTYSMVSSADTERDERRLSDDGRGHRDKKNGNCVVQ